MARRRTRKQKEEVIEAVEMPPRYFVELVDRDQKAMTSEGRVEFGRGKAAYNRACVIWENGGYAEEVVGVRLVDQQTGETLMRTE